MLRTPKQRFVESTHSGAWGKIVQGEVFEDAMYAAFDELNAQLPLDTPSPQVACDAYQQLVGARKLMDILSTLYVPDKPTTTQQHKGLDYSAGV